LLSKPQIVFTAHDHICTDANSSSITCCWIWSVHVGSCAANALWCLTSHMASCGSMPQSNVDKQSTPLNCKQFVGGLSVTQCSEHDTAADYWQVSIAQSIMIQLHQQTTSLTCPDVADHPTVLVRRFWISRTPSYPLFSMPSYHLGFNSLVRASSRTVSPSDRTCIVSNIA